MGTKPKLIALSVAACFGLSGAQALANPTGGTVSSGSASFASSGNTLTVTNSANAIINWQSFSIGVNEITKFVQSSNSSAVLNRVVGANGAIPQSQIDGLLQSVLANGAVGGRVFLLNPSGVVIGPTGRIDVAGFVASSLNLSDADFLAGKMRFTQTPGAGKVSNAGEIDTSASGPGGRVWLVGPDVQNSGVIRSPQGEIILAAGKSVELVSEGSPFVTVNVVADAERALNLGKLIADSGRVGMFGALVRQGGVVQADSAVLGPNGEIRLVATQDLTLDAGSVTTANGPSGGKITLQAQGGTNLVYGTVEAKGSAGQGGTVQALGVRVGVLGKGVIDASGETGGGAVLVGGDQHGANPDIQNAQQTLIGPDGVIRADAATTGDGGRVIVWSDASTRIFGSVSARGGSQSGNGGFVETSSKGDVDVNNARIDTGAPKGQGGLWLLDPLDVVIEANSYGAGDPLAYATSFTANPGNITHVTRGTLENNFLYGGTISLQATRDALFHSDLNLVYSSVTPVQTFEVRAVRNIDLAADGIAHTITTNGQNVTLSASDIGTGATAALNPGGTGAILGYGIINTNGGNVNLSGYGININAVSTSPTFPIIVGAGNVTMLTSGGNINTGSITTHAVSPPTAQVSPGGSVSLTTTYGNINVYGTIDSRGATGFDTRSSAQGTDGGAVILVRSDRTTQGRITVTGDIVTSGGDGTVASAALSGIPNGGAGGYISIGSNNAGGIPGQVTPVYGDVVVQGNMITRGGNGGVSPAGVVGADGGIGGVIVINASNNVRLGSSAQNVSNASGGKGGLGAAATTLITGTSGGNGGSGGVISVYGGTLNIAGGLISYGGAGGVGGLGTAVLGYGGGDGGTGGAGGTVTLNGTGAVIAAAITTTGGYGGAGGVASGAAAAGSGGGGGDGGAVSLASTGSYVSIGAILTSSGNNGDAGGTGGGAAFVNTSFSGDVTISAATTITAGDIITSGGGGGIIGLTLPVQMFVGGQGGAVNMNATGDINTGAITTTGGAGSTLAGGGAYAGNAGTAGNIVLGSNGSVTTGAIDISGGGDFSLLPATLNIGALVNITTGPITARALTAATYGGSVSLAGGSGQVTVNGTIDVRGANGTTTTIDTCGDVCFGTFLAGSNGGSVKITRSGATGVAIQTGNILASGGNGVSLAASPGGNGGAGGTVSTTADYGGAVSVGSIDVHGGNGADGKGGLVALAYAGGIGGQGGSLTVRGSTASTGDINAAGGAGGVGAADSGTVGASNGGNGGNGGLVGVTGFTGTVAVGNITAAGGAGGAGGKGKGVLAGVGGNGGYGGSVTVQAGGYGDIDMTFGGAISVAGGAGGAGGAGDPVKGGNGGTGGNGGAVDLFSPYGSIIVIAALNIDGTVLGGGAAPASISVANGGAGGAGGADFGLGAGIAGVNGLPSPAISVTGNVEVTGTGGGGLDANTIVQSTNLLLQMNNAPPSDDKKDKDDKQKKGIAACK